MLFERLIDLETSSGGAPTPAASKPADRDRSQWEAGDDYHGILFQVPGTNYRVAVCKDGQQWLVQQKQARDRWINRKFIARKQHLAVVLKRLVGLRVFQAVEAKIAALPI